MTRKLSDSQLRTLRWVANSSVWNGLLDQKGQGNRRRVVASLYRAGLVDEEVGGMLRPTPKGWTALISTSKEE